MRQALRFGLREGSGEPPSGLGRPVQCGVMGIREALPLLEEQNFFFASVTVCGYFFLQYDENTVFSSKFSADGLHDWGIYLERFHVEKGSVIVCGCFISTAR